MYPAYEPLTVVPDSYKDTVLRSSKNTMLHKLLTKGALDHPDIPETNKQDSPGTHAKLNPFALQAAVKQQFKPIFPHIQVTSNSKRRL